MQGAFTPNGPVRNFVSALYQALRIILPREAGLVRLFRQSLPLDVEEVDQALSDRYSEHVDLLAKVYQGDGSRVGLYFREVAVHDVGEVPRFYLLPLAHGVMLRFLRFRLGCHHLHVNTGRWARPALPRAQRACLRCATAGVDDEEHCLWHCAHPPVLAQSRPDVLFSLVQHYSLLAGLGAPRISGCGMLCMTMRMMLWSSGLFGM